MVSLRGHALVRPLVSTSTVAVQLPHVPAQLSVEITELAAAEIAGPVERHAIGDEEVRAVSHMPKT